jgi:rod shape-determining protein MreC
VAALGSPAPRPAAPSSFPARAAGALRRRAVVAVLVILSLALLSVYFRESSSGPLHSLQSAGATVLKPFEVGAERVARPFRDAAHWFGGLLDAKSENTKLRKQVEHLRQQAILNQTALQENAQYRALLRFRSSGRYPKGFDGIGARVIARPAGEFVEQMVVDQGSNAGIRVHDPVVAAQGLVGQVTKVARNVSLVTLLTDDTSAASGLDLRTQATGIVRHATGDSLVLDRVTKDQVVEAGDTVVTAGWRAGKLSDIYPKGIPIGVVTSVGQVDTDLYKQVQVEPFVDFSSLESVLVLVAKQQAPR